MAQILRNLEFIIIARKSTFCHQKFLQLIFEENEENEGQSVFFSFCSPLNFENKQFMVQYFFFFSKT